MPLILVVDALIVVGLVVAIMVGEVQMRREARLTNGVYGSKAAGCGGGGAAG